MTKRMLDEVELRMANRSLEMLKADADFLEQVEIPKREFTLKTADIVVKKQLKDTEMELKILTNQLEDKKSTIEELEKQINEGVEVKEENKKEDEEDE
jgi:hypothetical protein